MQTDFSPEALAPKPISERARAPEGMRRFTIARRYDKTGVSGTGVVIQGVQFATGHVVIQWLTQPDGDIQTKDSLQKFLDIHVLSHPENGTILTWEDGVQQFFPEDWHPPKSE